MIWLQRLRKDVLVDCLEIALDREKTSCQIVSGFCESCFCLKNLSSACLRDSHLSFQEIRFKIVRLFHFPAQERQEQLKCKEHEQRTPMKLKVKCKNCYYHKEFSLKRPRYDASATLRSLSEQPFDFTMHYNGHRESTYVTVNRCNWINPRKIMGDMIKPRHDLAPCLLAVQCPNMVLNPVFNHGLFQSPPILPQ